MTEEELARHDSKTLLQLLLSADARCDALTGERDRLRAALTEWDALIEYQYSGSREAMHQMTLVAQKTAKLLKGESHE